MEKLDDVNRKIEICMTKIRQQVPDDKDVYGPTADERELERLRCIRRLILDGYAVERCNQAPYWGGVVIVNRKFFLSLASGKWKPFPYGEWRSDDPPFGSEVPSTVKIVSCKRMPFGKHAGKSFGKIETQYLEWITTQDKMRRDVYEAAEHELSKRKTSSLVKEPQ
jgi:hypothetical protein